CAKRCAPSFPWHAPLHFRAEGRGAQGRACARPAPSAPDATPRPNGERRAAWEGTDERNRRRTAPQLRRLLSVLPERAPHALVPAPAFLRQPRRPLLPGEARRHAEPMVDPGGAGLGLRTGVD